MIPAGIFVSGTFRLKSHVTLELAEGAVLKASPDIRDYTADTHHNRYRNEEALDRCFIYAQDQENIGITGRGEIDGSAEAFPNAETCGTEVSGAERYGAGASDREALHTKIAYRPMMLRFLRCKNIRIDGVRLFQSASWTAAFLDSSYIWVSRVHIFNDRRYNGDGLDFDGCAHVFVEGCSITGTDDNLCLQAGSRKYPVKDIHISNCEFSSLCAGIRIGLKSIGDIYNVVISNCTMNRVWREGIKIECTEGGKISDIAVQNVVMRDVSRPIFVILNNRFEPEDYGSSLELSATPSIGRMENLIFSNIIATDSEEMKRTHFRFGSDIMGEPKFGGIRIDAEKDHPIRGLSMEHIRYRSIGGVKKTDIPQEYPEVKDRLAYPAEKGSENYYPDWSRAAFLDIRNVRELYLSDIQFSSIEPDERRAVYVEGCRVLKQEIFFTEQSDGGNETTYC